MKKTDRIAYSQKTVPELIKLLAEAKKKLVNDRSKFTTGNLKDTSVFKKAKYEIALICGLLKQNENK